MIPSEFFAFPLNLIIALIWISACVIMWRSMPKSLIVRFFLSPSATIISLLLFLSACMVLGFTGKVQMTRTWWFGAILLFMQTVLVFIVMRGWRRPTATGARLGAVRWRFLLLHVGILLAVGSAFWGAPDTEDLRLRAFMGVPVKEAYDMDGRVRPLPYEIELKEFDVTYGNNGVPDEYVAELSVAEENVVLKVNHPYSISFGEDMYLMSYDDSGDDDVRCCVIQIVRQPWKYGVVMGIIMLLAGAFLLFVQGTDSRASAQYDR